MKNAWRNKPLWFSLIRVFSIVLLNRTICLYLIFWLKVINDGEITATTMGTTLCAEGEVKNEITKQMLEDVKSHWREHYSINFNNYGVEDAYTPKLKVVNGV